MTTVQKIFVRVLSFNLICLLILGAYFWRSRARDNQKLSLSRAMQTAAADKEAPNSDTSRPHRKSPLLCMFTTFKPKNEKLPVKTYLITYLQWFDFLIITGRCYAKHGYAKVCCPSVRPSVCPSVIFRYVFHTGSNTLIISRLISLRLMLGKTRNTGDLVQREHSLKLGRNTGGVMSRKPAKSLKRCNYN